MPARKHRAVAGHCHGPMVRVHCCSDRTRRAQVGWVGGRGRGRGREVAMARGGFRRRLVEGGGVLALMCCISGQIALSTIDTKSF